MAGEMIKRKSQAKHRLPASTNASKDGAVALKILTALAEFDAFKKNAHDKKKVAIAVGYKSTDTKTFREAIKQLRDNGDVEYPSASKVCLTDQGRNKVGRVAATKPKTNGDMLAQIVQIVKVPGVKQGCGKFVDALKDGSAKTKLQVAHDLGLSSTDTKSFRNVLKALKEQGIVECVEGNLIRLSDDAFPQGRPV